MFTIRLQGDIDSTEDTDAQFDQAVGTVSKFPIAMDVSASKTRISKGQATFISGRVKNISAIDFNNLELIGTLPEGFTFIDSASRFDGRPVNASVLHP